MCKSVDQIYCALAPYLPDQLIGLLYALVTCIAFGLPFVFIHRSWMKQAAAKGPRVSAQQEEEDPLLAELVAQGPPRPLDRMIQEPSQPAPQPTPQPAPEVEEEPEVDDDDYDDDEVDPLDTEDEDDEFEDEDAGDEAEIIDLDLGEWVPLLTDNREEHPHALLDGPTGAGKTTLAQALAHCYLANGGHIFVINPNHKKGQWGDRVVCVDDEGELDDINRAFAALLAEFKRRSAVLKAEGPDALDWLQIIWDEVPETVEDSKEAALFLRKVLRRGRAIKIGILGIVQLDTNGETGLKGRAGLKRGFTHIRLGLTARKWRSDVKWPRGSRPALFERDGRLIKADLEGVLDLSSEHIPDEAFFELDYEAIEDADIAVKWTARHVQVAAMIAADPGVSMYKITKALFPNSDGTGGYNQQAKRVVEQVRKGLVMAQRKAVAASIPDDDDDQDS